MKKATVSQLRCEFNKIERLLQRGEEILITKRGRLIARLVPENERPPAKLPNFRARMRAIYGDKVFAVSGAELVSKDRDRY